MTYWQVSSGDRGRDFSDLFFKFGIMCVGGKGHIETIKEVEEGDIVILKRGRSDILAAGKIIKRNGVLSGEDEEWFSDFDGWTLEGFTNVEWHQPKNPIEVSSMLGMGTIMRAPTSEHQKIAEKIIKKHPKLPFRQKPNFKNLK